MKYDFYSFLKSEKLDRISYNQFMNNQNLYFLHSKRDKLWDNKPGGDYSLYFRSKGFAYNLCPEVLWDKLNILENDIKLAKTLQFTLTLTSNLYTSSENKFYSIDNQLAKEKPTGLPVFKGSSLKGALRQAAVDNLEDELMERNYGEKFSEYMRGGEEGIIDKEESNENDRFFFKERAKLVRLFGNEKDIHWFTFKSLLATGGIRDVSKMKDILEKISIAFERYLKQKGIVNSEGVCRGRLIFTDLYFKKVALDVITPLKRDKRTPASGPIYYEVVPAVENTIGAIIWFPFDLITKGESEERINKEWEEDRKLIKRAFEKLQQMGIGAKTKNGWGRFEINWEDE